MTIEQRLAKLEQQNRWMKRGGGLMLAAVACVVLMGQGKPKELPDLVAKSLTIKDAKGGTRATLYEVSGAPYFTLRDKAGNTRVKLSLLAGGEPLLRMYDAKGKVIWQAPK